MKLDKSSVARRTPARNAELATEVLNAFWSRVDQAQPWQAPHWLAWACIDAGLVNAPDFATMRARAAYVLSPGFQHALEDDADSLAEAALALYDRTAGPDPLGRAAQLALDAQMNEAGELSPRAQQVLHVARQLAKWFPAGFVLPQVRLAELLGCSQRAVSAIIARLVHSGMLVVADARWDHTSGRAKMYRTGRRVD